MEFYLISFLHFLVCIVVFIAIRKSIKTRGIKVLSLGALIFFLISSVGLIFSHYIDYGAALPFGDDSGMVVYRRLDVLYFHQAVSHWIFFAVLGCAIALQKKRFSLDLKKISLANSFFWKVTLVGVFLFAYTRYFIFGPGLETLLGTNLMYFSAEDAVAARTVAKDNLYGQGAYMASVAAYIILPVLFAGLISGVQNNNILSKKIPYFTVLSVFFLLSFVYAFQTRQKSPIIQVFLAYFLLHICRVIHKRGGAERGAKSYSGVIIFGGIFLFLLAVILYVLVFNMDFYQSIFSTVARVFMVPTATEANYFYVFPDIFPYRGLMESFVIRIFYPPGVSGVSIYDVAVAATGNQFTANASFIAVAWSGFGYLGVAIVSISLCLSLLLVDNFLYKKSYEIKSFALALSVPSLLILNSGSFTEYLGAGGVIAPMLFILVAKEVRVRSYV